jgi:DNA-binding transcriptional regulator YhcF (GntR family)
LEFAFEAFREDNGEGRMTVIRFHSTRDGQLAQDSESQRDSARKLKMSDIMDKTICEMRNLGASDKEIAGTLRHAVDVLEARED